MVSAIAHRDAVFLRAAPTEDGKQKTYTFRLSDGGTDRYKTRFKPEGWKLDNFNANGVVFLNHDGWYGGLPIASGRAYVKDGELLLDVSAFDDADPTAQTVQRKIDKGLLKACSIGAKPLRWAEEPNPDGSYDCLEQELYEASIVGIPGNPRSLRLRGAESAEIADLDEVSAQRAPKQITGDEFFARALSAVRKE
jgi:hypothetical protein